MLFWMCLASGCESRLPESIADQNDAAVAAVGVIIEPLCIQLTGTNHRWQVTYPALKGVPSAIDLLRAGRDLHVPVDTSVVLILKSTDFIYTLAIPEFGLKEIAVPDLEFRMTFRPMQVGHYPLIGEELCGSPESEGPGQLIVESQAKFQAWLRR